MWGVQQKRGHGNGFEKSFEMSPYHKNCQHLSSQISTPHPLAGYLGGSDVLLEAGKILSLWQLRSV